MKKTFFLLAAVCLLVAGASFSVQATPEKAEITGFSCGFCHSGGRHHGN
ncbi:MAG: hypothetical protein ACYCYR_15450 [Desulfobulbaceae bacterium]|jgi:hypothetical protein